MNKEKMKVEYWNVDKVIPYENNPRNNDSAVSAVKSSIEEFGFVNPILVDTDGVIVAGHTRLKAAQELGMEKVPVVVADHLTEKQVKAYRIVDNSTASVAGWDIKLLELEIEDLPDIDFELYGLDIDLDDLSATAEYVSLDGGGDNGGTKAERLRMYTPKVTTPIYEMRGIEPDVSELMDTEKCSELIRKIEDADVPEEVKSFLKLAAHRHVVFDYENIADYYAYADKEVQELMEDSALVIIDFNKAVENGFARIQEDAISQYQEEYPDAE